MNRLTTLAVSAAAMMALAACSTTGEGGGSAAAPAQPFDVASVSISPMTTANLCSQLGGQGKAPTITIKHTAAAGVPIRLHMQDKLSDGSTFNHRSTRVSSDGSGTTVVNYGFLPPCNTTGGRLNSNYQLTVEAGGNKQTVNWARFDSASRTIR